MNIQFIKIYGERNSGTNYLERILRLNFRADILRGSQPLTTNQLTELTKQLPQKSRKIVWEVLLDYSMMDIRRSDFGWKHGIPPFEILEEEPVRRTETLFIVLTKSPYTWLRSLYERPYHDLLVKNYGSFSEFIRRPWVSMSKDNVKDLIANNPIEHWTNKQQGFRTLSQKAENVLYLRYEDLLSKFEEQMEHINRFVPRKFPARPYQNIQQSTKGASLTRKDYMEKYSTTFLPNVDKEDLKYINKYLNDDDLAFFGYHLQLS